MSKKNDELSPKSYLKTEKPIQDGFAKEADSSRLSEVYDKGSQEVKSDIEGAVPVDGVSKATKTDEMEDVKAQETTRDDKTNDESLLTVDSLISLCSVRRKTKGKTKQFIRKGGFEQALSDFNSLGVKSVKEIPSGYQGILKDGRKINVRARSRDERPTIEIIENNKRIKIRYNP